jgi:hypothetical protein
VTPGSMGEATEVDMSELDDEVRRLDKQDEGWAAWEESGVSPYDPVVECPAADVAGLIKDFARRLPRRRWVKVRLAKGPDGVLRLGMYSGSPRWFESSIRYARVYVHGHDKDYTYFHVLKDGRIAGREGPGSVLADREKLVGVLAADLMRKS